MTTNYSGDTNKQRKRRLALMALRIEINNDKKFADFLVDMMAWHGNAVRTHELINLYEVWKRT